MADDPQSDSKSGRDWKQLVTWLIGFACGGLGGAVLTLWYTNRSTVIQYSVTKSVLGTNQTTVVPNFRVQVGDTTVQALYLHTLKIQYLSGPELENAKVGIELKPAVKLIGNTVAEKPGEALDFKCEPFEVRPTLTGTSCTLRRLNSHIGAYTVSFATDGDTEIGLSVDAKNTETARADIPEKSSSNHDTLPFIGMAVLAMLAGIGTAAIQTEITKYRKKPRRST